MMRSVYKNICGVMACLVLLFAMTIKAGAQRLPNVQKESVRAPANVKMDGRANEWGQFQAFNKSTVIYYTIANDNQNLYLAVKAERANMIKKSIMAGITLIVKRSDKKNDTSQVAVTFPLIYTRDKQLRIVDFVDRMHKDVGSDAMMERRADTLMRVANKDIEVSAKLILVKGIKQIADSLISIYNEENIEAVCKFDSKMNYIYELAIPLKYLGLSMDKPGPFVYQLRLNGANSRFVNQGGNYKIINGQLITSNLINQDWVNTTDFWGVYMLAK